MTAGTVVLALGLVVAPLSAAALVVTRIPRATLGALLGVYLGAGLVLGSALDLRLGGGLFLTGLICTVVLASSFRKEGWVPLLDPAASIPQGRAFRIAAATLVSTAAWGLTAPGAGIGLPVSNAQLGSAAIVLSMGLLLLGLAQDKATSAIGILAALAGFEMIYSTLEPSLAMRAVLAAVMIGIALAVSLDPEPHSGFEGEDRRGR